MSHFTVLVAGDPEIQLDPFYEQPEPPDYRLKWTNCTEQVKDEWETGERNVDGELLMGEECAYATIEEFAENWHGYEYREDIDQWGYWSNPNAKWDWWEIGGRWAGLLKTKGGGTVNQCPRKNLDFDTMLENQKEGKEEKWNLFQKYWNDETITATPEDVNKYEDWCKRYDKVAQVLPTADHFARVDDLFSNQLQWWSWGLDDVEEFLVDKETFMKPDALTYAFVDENGKWHQRGEMGWFGMDNKELGTPDYDEAFWEFIDRISPKTLLSVVDCHI